MPTNLEYGIKYGAYAGGLTSVVNPVVQWAGGNLEFGSMLWQEARAIGLGITAVALFELAGQVVNLPEISQLAVGMLGASVSGLLTRENGQNLITGSALGIGAIAGFAIGPQLDVLMIQLSKGAHFFQDALNRMKNFKLPNIPN